MVLKSLKIWCGFCFYEWFVSWVMFILSICFVGFDCRFEMERMNSKLYMENCLIMQENEKLRRKAQLLNQENQALLSQLKQRLTMGDQNVNNAPNHLTDLNLATTSNHGSSSRKPWRWWNYWNRHEDHLLTPPILVFWYWFYGIGVWF